MQKEVNFKKIINIVRGIFKRYHIYEIRADAEKGIFRPQKEPLEIII